MAITPSIATFIALSSLIVTAPIFSATSNADISRALRRLHQDYVSVGLFDNMAFQEFEALVCQRIPADELSDMFDGRSGADLVNFRTALLGRVFGIKSDWRFDPADIVAQVNRALAPAQMSMQAELLGRITEPRNGRSWTVSQFRLKLSTGVTVAWHSTLLPGFMEGINELLKRGRVAGSFLGLQTDGDYHVFIYATPRVRDRIERSKLFKILHEPDPTSRIVEKTER